MTEPRIHPLQGRTILATRARGQGRELQESLEELGARVVHIPTIEIVDPEIWGPVDQSIARLETYDWLILTSANAVERFFERVGERAEAMENVRIAVVGSQTARRVRDHGREPDRVPEMFRAEALIDAFPADLTGTRILLPRAEVAGDALPRILRERGAIVDVVVVYRTAIPREGCETLRALLADQAIDCITLTSGRTVDNLIAMVDSVDAKPLLAQSAVAVIGPVTRRAVESAGLKVAIEPARATIPALVEAIAEYFSHAR